MDYAQPRENWTPGGSDEELTQWMTQQYESDPNWKIPHGYQLKDGRIQRDLGWQDSWLAKNFWWMPAAAAGGYALAGMGGAAPAVSAAPNAGALNAGLMGTATGPLAGGMTPSFAVPEALASGAGAATGAATAGGVGSHLAHAAARAAVPVGVAAAGRIASGGNGGRGEIPPELRQILELQRQRLQMQGPLYESILRLAQSRLPMSARQGQSAQGNPQEALQRLAGNRRA